MVLAALCLSACSDSDIQLPKVFGTEVPPEVLNAPRVVPTAQPTENREWPLLGKVPSKPKDFSPQQSIDAAKDEMHSDRNEAQHMQHEYQVEQE